MVGQLVIRGHHGHQSTHNLSRTDGPTLVPPPNWPLDWRPRHSEKIVSDRNDQHGIPSVCLDLLGMYHAA